MFCGCKTPWVSKHGDAKTCECYVTWFYLRDEDGHAWIPVAIPRGVVLT